MGKLCVNVYFLFFLIILIINEELESVYSTVINVCMINQISIQDTVR